MLTIKPVRTPTEQQAFLDLPKRLFADHPHFVCPFDSDIRNTFDPEKNPLFQNGAAERWLAVGADGRIRGRVAAFVDHHTANTFDCPTGGMGFFDCEEDEATAFQLFDTCRHWLQERGLEAMNGPINFGENYRFWGLYTSGDSAPIFGYFYHPTYYQRFFEAYGFRAYFNQNFMQADIRDFRFVERVVPGYEALMEDPLFNCRHLGELGAARFVTDFCDVFNRAWAVHTHFTPIQPERFAALLRRIKPIHDPELFWIAYHGEQPVGVFLMLRDLNPFLQQFNDGQMSLWRKICLKLWLYRGGCRRIYAMAFGIVPEFQHLGVGHLLMIESARRIIPQGNYDTLEIAWVGDFNPKMLRLMSLLHTEEVRRYTTFRLVFDPERGVERAPVI